jgi:copper(I)-binding protein
VKKALFVLAAMLGFASIFPAAAAQKSGLSFRDAYLRSYGDADARSAPAYLTIVNDSDKVERLVSASSSASERVELHKIMDDHGLRRMHEVEEIDVPPHGSTALKKGTYHLMFVNLKQPLVVGKKVPVYLRFASGERARLMLPIVEIKTKKP